MEKGVEEKREFKSLVAGIKRIADDPKGLGGNTYDQYKEDLSIKGNAVKKNINDFTSKAKGKTENKKDIFSDILDTMDGFLGADNEDQVNSEKKPYVQSKTLRYAKQAAQKSLQITRQLITDEVKKGFFAGQGSCDSNTNKSAGTYYIKPSEFDFVNTLKVNPASISGKVMYESQPDPGLGIQFNRELYSAFDETPYEFYSPDDPSNTLFTLTWEAADQHYKIEDFDKTDNVSEFIDSYYNSIEQPDIEGVLKNAMLMTLQGDGSEPSSFNTGMDYLNRLLTKLFSVCGNSAGDDSPFLTNATNQLYEDEVDIQDYFNFDDVEGIDLDDEDARKRRVLKFATCNNFEVPTNSNHMEDFAYLLDTKNIDENINGTLKKAAVDAYGQSDDEIYLEGFELSIMTNYILQIPKALISSVLSPKMMFPISLSYQMIKDDAVEVKDMMKELSGMFFSLIKSLFWNFIKEFWALVKRDLLNFVKRTATTIVLNKFKKIKAIILSLISLLLKVLESGIQSCSDIFSALLNVIKAALNRSVSTPIPGLLLVLSQSLPGFSSDRAYMDALDRLEASGINTGDIYGTENKLPALAKSMIESYSNEMDANSYVKIGLNPTIIPAGPGGAVISPLITGSGKLF